MSYVVKYKNVHEPDLPVYNRAHWLLISNIYAYIFFIHYSLNGSFNPC